MPAQSSSPPAADSVIDFTPLDPNFQNMLSSPVLHSPLTTAGAPISTQQTQTPQFNPSPPPDDRPNSHQPADIISILQSQGKITSDQIEEVSMEQIKTGTDIDQLLIDKKLVNPEDLAKAKAKLYDVPFMQANELTVSPEAITLVPRSVAQKFIILPFRFNKETNELAVAMADPTDLQVIGFLEQKTSAKIKPYIAIKEDLLVIIEDRYGTNLSKDVTQVLKEANLGGIEEGMSQFAESRVIQQAPISKIVTYILEYAVRTRSSDIHIEPEEAQTRVRYRIDGILYEKLVLPKPIHDALISRIKILGKMKIDERRAPQDGRFNYTSENNEVDLRVSSLPTVHGEKIVLRLLKKTGGAKTLPELGLRGRALKNLEEAILRPHGIILVCGPTGSGKTTTLYSVISKINSPKVNILTLEDPVEYQIKGVNQVQINPQAGLTFASGLRSFLRQDPNVIMVGEVRDGETAELAIQAALTGHLVFSTLHTNDAAGALPRLLDMEVEPFLLSSTINAVVAQRVVRKICPGCQVAYPVVDEVIGDIKTILGNLFPQKEPESLYKGKGCVDCSNTGYSGRVGIFEVLPMTEKVAKLVMEQAPASQISLQATKDGMITMKQDGYLKVVEGITSLEEVLRVAQD